MEARSGKAMLAKIYRAFTNAENTKLFTDEAEAAGIRAGDVEA